MTTRKQRVINQLTAAIKELKEARRFIRNNRPEAAEVEIGDSLQFTGKALRNIHKKAPR